MVLSLGEAKRMKSGEIYEFAQTEPLETTRKLPGDDAESA